jgi:hypothetical protein
MDVVQRCLVEFLCDGGPLETKATEWLIRNATFASEVEIIEDQKNNVVRRREGLLDIGRFLHWRDFLDYQRDITCQQENYPERWEGALKEFLCDQVLMWLNSEGKSKINAGHALSELSYKVEAIMTRIGQRPFPTKVVNDARALIDTDLIDFFYWLEIECRDGAITVVLPETENVFTHKNVFHIREALAAHNHRIVLVLEKDKYDGSAAASVMVERVCGVFMKEPGGLISMSESDMKKFCGNMLGPRIEARPWKTFFDSVFDS